MHEAVIKYDRDQHRIVDAYPPKLREIVERQWVAGEWYLLGGSLVNLAASSTLPITVEIE